MHALYQGVSAQTTVTVTKKTVVVDPTAGANPDTKFGGTVDTNGGPQIVYPPTGIVIPPNLNTLEIHWIPAAGQDLFAIDFDGPTASYTAYTGCQPLNGGCVYNLDPQFWSAVAEQSAGTKPVKWRVRGVSSASPGTVGQSPDSNMAFTVEDLKGGLYYWNTGGSIMRYDFGLVGAPAETYLPGNPLACQGCHAVSRDGSRSVAATSIPGVGPYTVYEVQSKTPIQINGQTVNGVADFFAFNSDGSKLLLNCGNGICMRDLVTGVQDANPIVQVGTMPDWSPDGKQITYAQEKTALPFPISTPGTSMSSISVMAYDGATAGAAQTLVPTDGVVNNYYPAYSPDQNWIAFNRSPGSHSSYANDAPDQDSGVPGDGQLWVVSSSGGQPLQLTNATANYACSWAKWTPSTLQYYGGTIAFVTFTTEAPYGLRLAKGQQAQLFMAAFDGAIAASGQDGSFPAIWLPFQDISSGNRIAQWVTKVDHPPCSSDSDCGASERCVNGVCIPSIH